MQKNNSYIIISFVILVFGLLFIPKIVERIKNSSIVQSDRLDISTVNKTKTSNLDLIGAAPQFELINQNGDSISNKNYKNRVYVLEFFFTSCPTICPKMNQSMKILENSFFGNPNFGLVSITIDPITDTPKVLKAHYDLLKIKSSNWHFLTGDKAYIYDLANKGFNLYAGENKKVLGGFEHSGMFALIDKNGKIRCRKDEFNNPILYYDGLTKEGVKAIQEDIKQLLKE
jgi:protein SCO1